MEGRGGGGGGPARGNGGGPPQRARGRAGEVRAVGRRGGEGRPLGRPYFEDALSRQFTRFRKANVCLMIYADTHYKLLPPVLPDKAPSTLTLTRLKPKRKVPRAPGAKPNAGCRSEALRRAPPEEPQHDPAHRRRESVHSSRPRACCTTAPFTRPSALGRTASTRRRRRASTSGSALGSRESSPTSETIGFTCVCYSLCFCNCSCYVYVVYVFAQVVFNCAYKRIKTYANHENTINFMRLSALSLEAGMLRSWIVVCL